ncbi:MAG TPA: PQQ-binding-like beta-propeller repeat protein, partial [Pyrinomonadaceae bacterium]|nr:PQQ-binding-like beta-propeller repeat protein [Pyrinomonadaceae bacterium]
MRFCKRFSLAALLALFVAAQFSAADAPIWSYKGAKWYAMMETGNLIVANDASLAMIDGATGAVIWKRDDLKGIQETEYHEITGTPVVLVADNFGSLAKKTRLFALDQMTGKTVWETEKVYGYTVQVSPVKNRDMVVVLTTKSNAATKDKPDVAALKITTG